MTRKIFIMAVCLAVTCVGAPCKSNADCKEQGRCNLNKLQCASRLKAGKTCGVTRDCVADAFCEDLVCTPFGTEGVICETTAECLPDPEHYCTADTGENGDQNGTCARKFISHLSDQAPCTHDIQCCQFCNPDYQAGEVFHCSKNRNTCIGASWHDLSNGQMAAAAGGAVGALVLICLVIGLTYKFCNPFTPEKIAEAQRKSELKQQRKSQVKANKVAPGKTGP